MPRKNFSKIYLPIGLTAAIILLIFLNSIGWLAWPKKILYRVSVPIMKPFQIIGSKISGSLRLMADLKNLINENYELKNENQGLLLRLAGLNEAANENKLLRQQLQISPSFESKIVMGNLIGFDPGNLGKYFLINKGRKDGIKDNQAVIFSGGFLVGKVMETGDIWSKVLPLGDPASSVFALSQDSRVGGVVKGDFGVGLVLEVVPQQKQIQEGEIIITSGLNDFLPKGLIIGQAENRISLESEAVQKIKIKPSVNYREIETVFVILNDE